MSRTPALRQVLRRQLSELPQPRVQCCRAQAIGGRGYATEGKDERESFKGQLYQSTNERVERERAEEARFAHYREAQKASRSSVGLYVPGGRFITLTLQKPGAEQDQF